MRSQRRPFVYVLVGLLSGVCFSTSHVSGDAAGDRNFAPHFATEAEMQSCPHLPSGGGEDVQGFIIKTDGSCTLPDGGFARINTSYAVHTLAEAYGDCTTRALNCSTTPCTCVTTGAQKRKPASVTIWLYNTLPNSPFYLGPIYPNDSSLQLWDSRVQGQTTPAGRSWYTSTTLGEATFRFTENISTTSCSILPSTKVIEKKAYVLRCQPKFLNDNGNVPRLEPSTGSDKIEVFLDPVNMSSAAAPLDQAIQDWNTYLAGSGVEFQRTGIDCGSGPRCIKVTVGQSPNCGVAIWDPPNLQTGFLTGGLFLELHSNWNTFTDESFRRTFVHELGHFLGMDDYVTATGCGVNDAMLRDDFSCGPTSYPSVSLTGSDVLPVTKSTYGGGTKVSCGW